MSLWVLLSLFVVSLSLPCTNNYYLYNGSCNNKLQPNQGVADGLYRRGPEGAEPGDVLIAFGDPTQNYQLFSQRPNERKVSNAIISTHAVVPNTRGLNLIAMQFGQLLTHDLSQALRPADNRSNINITEEDDDFLYLLDGTRKTGVPPAPLALIGVRRSGGEQRNGIFEPHNEASGWLDAHFIYGLDSTQNTVLRTGQTDGKIWLPTLSVDYSKFMGNADGTNIYTEQNMLPTLAQTGFPIDIANIGTPPAKVLSAGDSRVSENILIGSLQTIWAREHNYNAEKVKAKNPTWTDEEIFQKARIITTAEYQRVTYKEYLPTVWGDLNVALYVGRYTGYRSQLDGSTGISFATAAMRVGHSTVKQDITLFNKCGVQNTSIGVNGILGQAAQPPLTVGGQSAFPTEMFAVIDGPTNLLQAAAFEKAEESDRLITDTLRNIRINSPLATGVDVSSANIRRGRIHSIPNYHDLRQHYYPILGRQIYGTPGCPKQPSPLPANYQDPLPCFLKFIESTDVATKARDLYNRVNNVDAYVGILMEKKLPPFIESNFGPTGTSIVLEQFRLSRDGDRFWYENLPESLLSRAEKRLVEATTFSQIIKRNSDVKTLNDNAFEVPQSKSLPHDC